MRPKIADIARETGLTIGTVSRALDTSGRYSIAKKTRERVLEAAHRLGYRPNLLGRALAVGSSKLILLLTPDPFAPYYVDVNRHLSNLAGAQGYSFLTASTLPKEGASIPANDWLYGADGLIVCDGMPAWERYVSEAMRLKIPVVGMGAVGSTFPADYVSIEIGVAARQLVAHLMEAGCRTPALMSTPGADRGDARYRAYIDASVAFGFPPRVVESVHQTRAAARQAAAEAYREQPFDALLCENDLMAMGALRGLTDVGARVPADVRLSGFDGLEESSYQVVPITTVVQPIEEMCRKAWELLQRRIAEPGSPPTHVNLVARLEIRPSTAA